MRIEAVLREQEGRGRATLAGIAIDDVRNIRREPVHFHAKRAQRYVLSPGNCIEPEFVRESDIQPSRTGLHHPFRFIAADRGHGGLTDEFVEVSLGQPHDRAVTQHGDGGVTRLARYQRLFTETGTLTQFGEQNFLVVEVLQRRRGYLDPDKQAKMDRPRKKPLDRDELGDFTYRAGRRAADRVIDLGWRPSAVIG